MHAHHHGHCEADMKETFNNLLLSAFFNGFLALFEWIAFTWSGSMPVNAAYLHDLADFVAAAILVVLVRAAYKAPYLWRVSDLLAGLFMIGATSFALWHSLEHMQNPQPIKTDGLAWLAAINFCANGVLALRMNTGKSGAEKAAALHFLQDAAGAGAILLTWFISSIIQFGERTFFDALIATWIAGTMLVIALLQIGTTIKDSLEDAPTHSEN